MTRLSLHDRRPRTCERNRVASVRRHLAAVIATLAAALTCAAMTAAAQAHDARDQSVVHFGVSCSAPAQAEFDRAVGLLHHMTYPDARAAFEEVARIDPRCGMAHWGIAMTLFQPLWPTRPGPTELQRGWDAVQRARALAPPTSRERALVEAAAAFFEVPASKDYWRRIGRWEGAMKRAYDAHPDDPEVAALYALAHLATAPADSVSTAHADRAARILQTLYERHPDHPGVMHYLVHASDFPSRERATLDVTRKYETAAPRNPHALHMPTHIYLRLGEWNAVVRGNLQAADAALGHPAGDSGQFVWDEFPHAIEYLIYAYLQQGADDDADAQRRRLHGTAKLEPTFKTAFHLASTQARYALERHAWREAMALPPREPATLDWDRYPWPEAVTWFARGLGSARTGDVAAARTAADRLRYLEERAASSGEALFRRNIQILGLEVRAWLAHAERDPATGVALMREAAQLELATPKHAVTPGPALPAPELLGDLLLAEGRPAEALAAYQRALELYPRRFNSVLGAARAARGAGDDVGARRYYALLLELAAASTRRPALAEARGFVGRDR